MFWHEGEDDAFLLRSGVPVGCEGQEVSVKLDLFDAGPADAAGSAFMAFHPFLVSQTSLWLKWAVRHTLWP